MSKDGVPATIIKINYSKYGARDLRTVKKPPKVERNPSDLITSIKEVLEPEDGERD